MTSVRGRCVAALVAAATSFGTNVAGSETAGGAERRRVVVGPGYAKGGIHRFWFGDGYRHLWTTPVELEVLDLAREAGGLEVVRRVGGLQTAGLALRGADGRSYTFRSLDKNPERILPEAWRETIPADVFRDQTSASHPAAAVVYAALAEAAGIRFPATRLVVMPDDARLGDLRQEFAGRAGTFSEYPTPGFAAATEIVSSEELYARWLKGPEGRVDSRAFLRARLLDMFTGNWDRHRNQWHWARVPDMPLWQPIPEDPDQCFSRYDGAAIGYVRLLQPGLQRFDDEYPGRMEGLTVNSADVNRWLLSDLERGAFLEMAGELQAVLTDAAIEQAVARMPPEWHALDGARLGAALQARRNALPEIARRFYEHLADRVDVRGSDRDEVARIRRDGGDVEVSLSEPGAPAPYYRRTFRGRETEEVRLYLLGGDDRVVTSGGEGPVGVRILGGAGRDVVDDGTVLPEDDWVNPAPLPGGAWVEPRNYGHWTSPMGVLWWDTDIDFLIGVGLTRTSWGFRKYPWSTLQAATLSYSTGEKNLKFDYAGQRRLGRSPAVARLDVTASGIEHVNYFGLGNDTVHVDKNVSRTQQDLFSAFPSLRLERPQLETFLGVEARYVDTPADIPTVVNVQDAYGRGQFGEVMVRGGFELDSRGRAPGLRGIGGPAALLQSASVEATGARLTAEGFYAPAAWDVTSAFGGVQGSLAGYLGNQTTIFAARVGGRRVWGQYPWFEAATVGGSPNVRGYDRGRFAGDAAVYANAELRFWLGHRRAPLLPLRWGVFLLADTGRVWLEGETSDQWHSSYGFGVLFQLIGLPLTFNSSVAFTSERTGFYFKAGYGF
jgi:hypothetical protein